jgi:hypothetical protein
MRKLFSFFLLGLAVTSCQNDVTHPVVANSNEKTNVCSSTSKVIRVPQEFQTIEEALSATAPPTTRLVIQVSYKTGGYLLKDGLTVDRPCTDLIGISETGQKPILRREEFGEHEQPIVKIAASNVLLKGFEIKGKYTLNALSDPSGVLVLIREDEKDVPGYSTISIEENDINNIGFQYPADQEKCWEDGSYICGDGHGIEIKSNSTKPITNVTVRGNKVHDLHLGQSEAVTISNNVNDFAVVDNEIYHVDNIGIDIAGFQDGQPFAATKGTVVSNRVYQSTARENPGQRKTYPWIAGIYIDGGHGRNLNEDAVLIERNVVYDYGFGIEIGAERCGQKVDNVIAQNNLLLNNWIVGIGVGHNDDDQTSYVENCVVRNNTLYQNHRNGEKDDAGELRITKNKGTKEPLTNIRYENNLVVNLGSGLCLVYADIKLPLTKFDLTFVNNMFVGIASEFWDCESSMNFQQFNSLTSLTLRGNEFKSDFPFEKALPTDPKLIVEAIRTGTIKDFFKPKAFAAGRGVSW